MGDREAVLRGRCSVLMRQRAAEVLGDGWGRAGFIALGMGGTSFGLRLASGGELRWFYGLWTLLGLVLLAVGLYRTRRPRD